MIPANYKQLLIELAVSLLLLIGIFLGWETLPTWVLLLMSVAFIYLTGRVFNAGWKWFGKDH